MNFIRRFVVERYLKSHGWKIMGYPFPRGHRGYKYSVYSHPLEDSTGSIEWAVKKERERAEKEKK